MDDKIFLLSLERRDIEDFPLNIQMPDVNKLIDGSEQDVDISLFLNVLILDSGTEQS